MKDWNQYFSISSGSLTSCVRKVLSADLSLSKLHFLNPMWSSCPDIRVYLLSFMAQVQQTKILSKVGDTDENDLEMKNNLLKTI